MIDLYFILIDRFKILIFMDKKIKILSKYKNFGETKKKL